MQESEHVGSMRHGRKRKSWLHEENGGETGANGIENGSTVNGAHAHAQEANKEREKVGEGDDGVTAMNIAHDDSNKPHD